ncbi:MAG: cbb3-type cytochrome oxidase assembly protein CcoS [Bdellovibrionales bacterium]|nr:cbb3-type cytochrome oxidase assembly protein CcoS [Bdellovibrionales bacterium]
MEIIVILIPLALLLAAFFIYGFIWMTKNGQYDDLETPRHRMLLNDRRKISNNHTQKGDL